MANTYFNYTNPVTPGATILSSKYNGDFRAVERAFDTLPAPNELVASYKNVGVTAGTTTAYTLNLPAFDASFGYTMGMQVVIKLHVTNTGPSTISVNGLPVRNIVNLISGMGALTAGDMRVGAMYSLRYDGTNFQLMNATSNVVAQTLANATSASTSAASANAAVVAAGTAYSNIMNTVLKVGAVKFFDTAVDPNVVYPGTTWLALAGTSLVAKGWRRTA